MANNSGASRREASRVRAEAQRTQARLRARLLWLLAGVLAVAVVVGLAFTVSQAIFRNAPTAEATRPPHATETHGIRIETQDVEPANDVPHLKIYEDPQCPGCASTEVAFGPAVLQLIDEGRITAEVITAHFLDANLGNDASERAANAAAAADAVGKYREFRVVMFDNQPDEVVGGPGYGEEQLRVDFPAVAGIEGDDLAKFQGLYDGRAFAGFVTESNDQFTRDNISSTPTYKVGENILNFFDESGQPVIEPTAEDLMRAIEEIA